jgi:hypothetical protein
LQSANNGVVLANRGESAAVYVKGEDAFNLFAHGGYVSFSKYFSDNGAFIFREANSDCLVAAIYDEGEMEMVGCL